MNGMNRLQYIERVGRNLLVREGLMEYRCSFVSLLNRPQEKSDHLYRGMYAFQINIIRYILAYMPSKSSKDQPNLPVDPLGPKRPTPDPLGP